jgi:hypothetical protein
MASMKEILEILEKVPHKYASSFTEMLVNYTNALVQLSRENLKKKQHTPDLTQPVTAQGQSKTFRKPPFLKDLAVNRDDQLAKLDQDDQPTSRPGGPT